MCTLLDAHVHLHDGFCVPSFLDSAARNFKHAAESLLASQSASAHVLVICAIGDEHPLARFHVVDGWSVQSPDEQSLVVRRANDTLLLIAGRQVVTREKLEVLSLFSAREIDSGLTLSKTVDRVNAHEGIPVLPWGFGKWTFARLRMLRTFLETQKDAASKFFLGDNGCRWQHWRPSMLKKAELAGVPVIAGSDPLPVPSHVHRAGRFGSILKNELDFVHPTQWLRNELRQVGTSPGTFGVCRTLPQLLSDQVCVRLKN